MLIDIDEIVGELADIQIADDRGGGGGFIVRAVDIYGDSVIAARADDLDEALADVRAIFERFDVVLEIEAAELGNWVSRE